jgi:hypothetical protein
MHCIIAGFVFVMAAFPSNVNAAQFAGKLKNVDADKTSARTSRKTG